jgi:hypothetical protein
MTIITRGDETGGEYCVIEEHCRVGTPGALRQYECSPPPHIHPEQARACGVVWPAPPPPRIGPASPRQAAQPDGWAASQASRPGWVLLASGLGARRGTHSAWQSQLASHRAIAPPAPCPVPCTGRSVHRHQRHVWIHCRRQARDPAPRRLSAHPRRANPHVLQRGRQRQPAADHALPLGAVWAGRRVL